MLNEPQNWEMVLLNLFLHKEYDFETVAVVELRVRFMAR